MSHVGIRDLAKVKSELVNREAGCNTVTQVRDGMANAENSGNPLSRVEMSDYQNKRLVWGNMQGSGDPGLLSYAKGNGPLCIRMARSSRSSFASR